ncbi:MAG: hypothetical protein H6R25_2745 [Proteobacteria bacterium]|nr:hypothetical protein [Pseudomonadota bacterium]
MTHAMAARTLTKNELSDTINVAIEGLVKHRYELPVFNVLLREARLQRAAANQSLFNAINNKLSETDRTNIPLIMVSSYSFFSKMYLQLSFNFFVEGI